MEKIFGNLVRLIQREPVAFQAFVQATLAVLVGFGIVHWSNEQIGLVLGAVAAFLALVTRTQVTPRAAAAVKNKNKNKNKVSADQTA